MSELFRILTEDVGRNLVQQRLDGLGHPGHEVLIIAVSLGVLAGVAGDFMKVLLIIGAEKEVVTILCRRERSGHRDNHHSVFH